MAEPRDGRRRIASWLALALAAVVCLTGATATSAGATETVRFAAAFNPDRLGASTTITLSFAIGADDGGAVSPLTGLGVRIPEGMGFAASTLGLDQCSATALTQRGLGACPQNARVGEGSALLAAPFGDSQLQERAAISIYMAPPVERHSVFSFYASGTTPLIANLLFQGTLLAASSPFGFDLSAPVPLTPLLPGEQPAAVLRLKLSIGPRHLLYEKTVHGKRVRYRPRGIEVPEACPHGHRGFPFLAELTFADGSHVHAANTVACPR